MTLGAYNVTANVVGASAPATFSLTNTIGPASHFSVVAPSSVSAGVAVSVTVTAHDQFGNTATGYTGTVHFTSTDTLATLPADSPFTAGDAGVRTFTVTFGSAGTQTITAMDTVSSTITGTSNSVMVTPVATTTALAISPPTAAHGNPVTLTAMVAPASATGLPSPTGGIAFSDGSTPLGSIPLVGGVATLTTSTLPVGLQHITATYTPASPGPYATSADTKDVTITAAALLSISVTPSPVTLKVGDTQQMTATGHYADNSTQDISGAVTWTSDSPVVVSVNGTGTATAQTGGTAHLTASQNGVMSNQVTVTVSAPTGAGITVNPSASGRSSGQTSGASPNPAPSPAPTSGGTTGSGPTPNPVPGSR